MASGYLVPSFLITSPFHTDRVLPTLKCPVLILHSVDDEIVPYSQGQKLQELAPASTLVSLRGKHDSGLHRHPDYQAALAGFLFRTGVMTAHEAAP